MSVERFKVLLSKYLDDTLTFREKIEFFELVEKGVFDGEIEDHFTTSFYKENQYGDAKDLSKKNKIVPFFKGKMKKVLLQSAAIFLAFLTIGFFIYHKNKKHVDANTFFSEFLKDHHQAINNNTKTAIKISLPDSSVITLQPASSLHYSTSNFTDNREVYMEGKALFNITKNPKSPFYVYYKDVVTKVLGTSFTIYTSAKTGNTEVEVLTGKVQVYANEKVTAINKKSDEIIIVTPNQKAVYENVNHTFSATLADEPKLLSAKERLTNSSRQAMASFNFNNVRLAEVIKNIELNYGISIMVSDERIYTYGFSGDLTNQGLFDKLKIITLATHTQYEVKGTTILLSDVK
jgi:transmembrane sensor